MNEIKFMNEVIIFHSAISHLSTPGGDRHRLKKNNNVIGFVIM